MHMPEGLNRKQQHRRNALLAALAVLGLAGMVSYVTWVLIGAI